MTRLTPVLGLIENSLTCDAKMATCKVVFTSEQPFFAGHFPYDPVVPGVIMLQGLLSLASYWQERLLMLDTVHEAKFRLEVKPDQILTYRLTQPADASQAGRFYGEISRQAQRVMNCEFTGSISHEPRNPRKL